MGDEAGKAQDALRDKKTQESYLLEKVGRFNNWGKILSAKEFEGKMKKLNPNFLFQEFSFDELKGAVLRGYPHDQPWHHKRLMIALKNEEGADDLIQIGLYPREILPEHSIISLKEDFMPNPEFISTGKTPSLSDLPKGPVDFKVKPSKESNLYKWFYDQGGISIRGWRELLLMCLQCGLVNLAQVEKEFGGSQSPEWARKVYNKETKVAVQL